VKNLTEPKTKFLYQALLSLNNEEECAKFLRDLLTEAEIREFSNRLAVAKMLQEKVPYLVIEEKTGMSSTTIARIQKWLTNGMGGYELILKRI